MVGYQILERKKGGGHAATREAVAGGEGGEGAIDA